MGLLASGRQRQPSTTLGPVTMKSHRVLAIAAAAALSLLAAGTPHAAGRVHSSPEAVQPLAPGQQVPKVDVRTVRGKRVGLADALKESGALLVFYRGGW